MNKTKDKISIPFHCADKSLAIIKDENGKQKRYLKGVSSGINIDAHGERMTEKAIKSFGDQAQKGEILLYADKHGIAQSDDIGRLVDFEITKDNEWLTTYQLYDGSEGAQNYQVERANTVFNQIAGNPPYKKPMQKGFSIEGWIPKGGFITSPNPDGSKSIDEVMLDGVVVVNRPAYESSVANAIFKCLGEKPPWQKAEKDMGSKIREKVQIEELKEKFWRGRMTIISALEEEIEDIMINDEIQDKSQALEATMDDFKGLMIELVLSSSDVFQPKEDDEMDDSPVFRDAYGNRNIQDLMALKESLPGMFKKFIETL